MSAISDCEYLIIGGGAVGCGVAYALAKAGLKDIQLVERAPDVGLVTTSQGAGLCGQARDSVERVKLAMHSVATFRELQKDPDVKPDWNEVGSIRIALSAERAAELQRLHQAAGRAGLETELLDPAGARRLWPLMNFERATAVLWVPSDGYMTPAMVVKAYEHQARTLGVRFHPTTAVEAIHTNAGRVSGARTSQGEVRCRFVINAAGAHAYQIARLVGLDLPIVPVRHEYFVTVPLAGLSPRLPCFRIPELTLYGRVREHGLLLGGWEPHAVRTDPRTYDLHGAPPPLTTDWQVLASFEKMFSGFLPASTNAEKRVIGKGWPTFTPDGRFIIGESCRVKGFVMAGGCNAHGISGSGGIGRLLVESLLESNPSDYVRSLSPDRFTETPWSWAEAQVLAARVYETYYGV